jgi:hypothetical protein
MSTEIIQMKSERVKGKTSKQLEHIRTVGMWNSLIYRYLESHRYKNNGGGQIILEEILAENVF